MLAFRSLDPFRALREPDRRRRDEERLSRSEQRTLSKTQNNHLTGKAPYKFESGLLQRRVTCEPRRPGARSAGARYRWYAQPAHLTRAPKSRAQPVAADEGRMKQSTLFPVISF